MFSLPPDVATVLERLASHFGGIAGHTLLTFGGPLSLASLLSAFCVAAAWITWQRNRTGKSIGVRALLRSIY